MFKKTLAALAAVLLGVGLSVAAVAAPASAHTGDLSASAECVNGEYHVTYTLKITNTNLNGTSYWRIGTSKFDGTPSSNKGMSESIATNGSGSYVLTTITLPGDSKKAPWAYAYSTWSDKYGYGSDGGDIALGGDCATTDIPVTVSAFPSATPPSCLNGGTLVIPTQTGVVFSGGTNGAGPGTYTIVASAAPGYALTAPYSKQVTVLPADDELCDKVTIPVSTMSQLVCVAGGLSGSYTLPDAGQYVEWFVNDVKTSSPSSVTAAGTVKVEAKITAAGLAAGVKFTDKSTSKVYTHEFVAPEDCERVTIPVSTKSQMECVAFSATGSYTLPETKWVEWYVNGALTTTPSKVYFPGDVVVEARITPAGIAAGIVFTDGTTSHSVTHTFVLPTESCDPPTLALLDPTASQNNGSCTADPSFTLSNTTSEHGGVQWWIGDPQTTITSGTHKAAWGSTVVVEAKVVDPVHDGLENSPAVWTFKFPAKPACGDLVTLALTGGSTGGFVPWIAGAMLLLGAAGIYFQRRLVTASK